MHPDHIASTVLNRLAFLLAADWTTLPWPTDVPPGWQRAQLDFDSQPDRPVELEIRPFDDGCPRVEVVLRRLDTPRSSRAEVLERLNALHHGGWACAASLDPQSGLIEVRSNICYTGYHDDPTVIADHNLEQCEATLNLLIQACRLAEQTLDIE